MKRMKLINKLCFALLVANVWPTFSFAQDISIKMHEIPKGSWFLMSDAGGPAMHLFLGKNGRFYIYDFVPGKDPSGQRLFRDFRDVNGNNVKRSFSDGREVTYKPHNCQRVVGTCTYTERGTDNAGKPYSTTMKRENTPKGNGFAFVVHAIADDGTRIPVRSGVVKSLDQMGMVERGRMKTHAIGKTIYHKKLQSSW